MSDINNKELDTSSFSHANKESAHHQFNPRSHKTFDQFEKYLDSKLSDMHKSTNRSDRTQPRTNFVEGSQSR